MQIEMALDFGGLGDLLDRGRFLGLLRQLLVENIFAEDDAVVANINAGAGNQFFDFGVGLPAKAAKSNISGSSHDIVI
jgi:hypothetical protein